MGSLLHALLPLLLHVGATEGPHAHAGSSSASWRERAAAWEPHLGRFAFNVTTRSTEAQRLFRIGLLLIYNFDQDNAKSAFQAALAVDAECAMCAWGLAHASGPYLNVAVKGPEDLALGLSAARNASALLARRPAAHSSKERALVGAMAVRYPADPAGDQTAAYGRYAAELRRLREADPSLREDPDMLVFDAEAVMILMCDRSGYHFYETHGDAAPPVERPETKEARALIRAALGRSNQTHPYAHHLLIHVTEMSNSEAETAVASAFKLQKEMAGLQDQHLQHMTSHTFLRTGRYHAAVLANEVATATDATYLRHGLMPNGPGHNSAFLVLSAMWGGERATAYRSAQVMQRFFAQHPDYADLPDGGRAWSLPMLVALRFGDWGLVDALDVVPPGGCAERWPYGHGVLRHFARGAAALHLGRPAGAEEHLAALRRLAPAVAATGKASLQNLTAIAEHVLSGALAHSRGDLAGAVEALHRAAERELAMPYSEPPDWPLPSRECLGQALLDAGRPREAEQVFRTMLLGYSFHAEPHCGWALFGLRASLLQQGPTAGRELEVQNLTQQLEVAWRHADVELRSPCSLLAAAQAPVLV